MSVEPRGLTEQMRSQRKGEPLGGDAHYGRRAGWQHAAGETLLVETEAGPEGQAGTGVPVLRAVRPDLSERCAGSGDGASAEQSRSAGSGRSHLGADRNARGWHGEIPGATARGTSQKELPAAGGAAGGHPEGEWEAEAAGDTGDPRQGGADGRAVDSGTDFRIGFPGLLVRIPARAECAPGAGGDPRSFESGLSSGV